MYRLPQIRMTLCTTEEKGEAMRTASDWATLCKTLAERLGLDPMEPGMHGWFIRGCIQIRASEPSIDAAFALAERANLDAAEVLYMGLTESKSLSITDIATIMLAEIEWQTMEEIL